MKVKRCILQFGEDPPTGLTFWCPGCGERHVIRVVGAEAWKWNGDDENPTIDPSVKCEHKKLTAEGEAMIARGEKVAPGQSYPCTNHVCHSVITAGMIRFCADSTHALANKTVLLPDLPDSQAVDSDGASGS